MSAPALPPTAPTTLVIVLGASAWPNSPGFQASEAFAHAAQGFRNYMLDSHGFGLSAANLLDLFDTQTSASDQLEMLGSFLEERTQALKAATQAVRDVLVYFAGHGGFAGPSADFYLMHRRANASSLRASGMAIDALAEVLREKARQTRQYLFLDCCFAAAAFRSFQGGPDQTAITKTLDAFQVQARSSGFPGKGTVLLCSSDQKSPSLLLPDESCTMFSYALLNVLRKGDLHRPPQLSLRDIKELAQDRLAALPEENAPRPSLHSPDQSEGDVADVPFFPNFSVRHLPNSVRIPSPPTIGASPPSTHQSVPVTDFRGQVLLPPSLPGQREANIPPINMTPQQPVLPASPPVHHDLTKKERLAFFVDGLLLRRTLTIRERPVFLVVVLLLFVGGASLVYYNPVDGLFLITVVGLVFNGLRNGFVTSLMNLLSLPIALIVTLQFGPQLVRADVSISVWTLPMLFFATVLIVHTLVKVLLRVLKVSRGNIALGGIVGFMEAWLLWVAILVLLGHSLAIVVQTSTGIDAAQVSSGVNLYNSIVVNSLFARVNSFIIHLLPQLPHNPG